MYILKFAKKLASAIVLSIAIPIFCTLTVLISLIARKDKPNNASESRIVWGPAPIINNKYWSEAMKRSGYISQTLMRGYSATINKKNDYNEYTSDRFRLIPEKVKTCFLFWESLFRFDVFMLSFQGWLLGASVIWFLEPYFLKIAGKRVVVIPYGGDAYVYRNVRSPSLAHGLMMSYPAQAKIQDRIESRVNMWVKHADCVIATTMGVDGIGRWDVLCPSPLCIDLEEWVPSTKPSRFDGRSGPVTIVHAPNHTGFKGTEFIVDAVDRLKKEGFDVELKLLQKIQNQEVRRILNEEADILVDQLIFTGHGLNAIEGMASGIPVICNLDDEEHMQLFRRWSFLGECPIVSATPETIVDQLRALVVSPKRREQLGVCGRQYVNKYHSYEAAAHLFSHVLSFVFAEEESIINLFHPMYCEYKDHTPTIDPPAIQNKGSR